MRRPAFIFHPDSDTHDTGSSHPENWTRTRRVYDYVRKSATAGRLQFLEPPPATHAQVEAVHAPAYRRFIEEACLSGGMMLDSGDTLVGEESYAAALRAAGGGVHAVDLVMSGGAPQAFSCARPPGHHACEARAMGFCLFNNVAVAARHAQRAHGVERVLIVDWDVHHGNGTQDIFYTDPSVLFFSIHQRPLYPGSGALTETGSGAGEGATINCPVPAGAQIDLYRKVWDKVLVPAARAFKPGLVLVSAGYDAHEDDPLADVCLCDADFAELTRRTLAIAQQCCGGRMVLLLEGGYNVPALCRSVGQTVQALCEDARR